MVVVDETLSLEFSITDQLHILGNHLGMTSPALRRWVFSLNSQVPIYPYFWISGCSYFP